MIDQQKHTEAFCAEIEAPFPWLFRLWRSLYTNGLLRTAADKRGSIGIQGGVEQYEA